MPCLANINWRCAVTSGEVELESFANNSDDDDDDDDDDNNNN